MIDTNKAYRNMYGHSDVWVGTIIAAVGAVAAWMATGFDAISKTYPLTLSLLLLVLGLVLVANAIWGKTQHTSFSRPMLVMILAGLIMAIWISGITIGLGYILPTFIMQIAFMALCGVSGGTRIAVYAAIVSAVSYLVFVVGLNVRLPVSLAPWLF